MNDTPSAVATQSDIAQQIIALEENALRRWCAGDPSGFLEISAEDVVYFDPFLPRRIDGIITRFEEGTVAVDLSRLERRIDGLERLAARMLAAILFAGLLIGGILLRPVDDVFGIVLMAASVVPLLAALFAGAGGPRGGRGPGRRP